jgi:hypothetical protein
MYLLIVKHKQMYCTNVFDDDDDNDNNDNNDDDYDDNDDDDVILLIDFTFGGCKGWMSLRCNSTLIRRRVPQSKNCCCLGLDDDCDDDDDNDDNDDYDDGDDDDHDDV